LLLFGYTALLFFACYKFLPESLPREKRQEFSPEFLWSSYLKVFKSPLFHLKAGTIAFNFGGLFLYISSAPVFITQHLKLRSDQFGWQFIPSVAGIFLGALMANRLAGKISVWKQVSIGFCFLIGASLFNVIFNFLSEPVLFWSVMPLFFLHIWHVFDRTWSDPARFRFVSNNQRNRSIFLNSENYLAVKGHRRHCCPSA